MENLVSRGGAHVFFSIMPRKQPFARLIFPPVLPEFRQQVSGEDGVTVFSSFALFDPDHHSGRVAFNVFRPQGNRLTEPQPGTVNHFQKYPVLQIGGRVKQTNDLFFAQDAGELLDSRSWRDSKSGLIPI